MIQHCHECGAAQHEGKTCEQDFHQLLFWEAEEPELGAVHHLMVLCYHLQHPSLYSPEGLRYARDLLAQFIDLDLTPQQVRESSKDLVDSNQRKWKIKATPEAKGVYDPPPRWTLTVADVAAAGPARYCEMVQRWAEVTHLALK